MTGTFPRGRVQEEIIIGFIEHQECITLLNSFETKRNIGASGLGTSTIISNYFFVGPFHMPTKKDIKFYKAIVYFNYLDEWMNISEGFNIDNDFSNKEINITACILEIMSILEVNISFGKK